MRLSRNGRCVTVKHAPFPPTATTTAEGRRTITLIQHPLPQVRLAGDNAYDDGLERWANPYEQDTAEFVNWDAGYRDASQRNS